MLTIFCTIYCRQNFKILNFLFFCDFFNYGKRFDKIWRKMSILSSNHSLKVNVLEISEKFFHKFTSHIQVQIQNDVETHLGILIS